MNPIYYVAQDATKRKVVLRDFDKDLLKLLSENGVEFYAYDSPDSCQKVEWYEVEEPKPQPLPDIIIPIISHDTFKAMIEPMISAIGELETTQAVQPVATLSSLSSKPRSSTPLRDELMDIYNSIVANFDKEQ